ncbi:DUF6225 family protein (plasmid) [Streptomyces sp. NBC_01298]|uniref:DUF6225 family protein n=1 Tax=Streptomyces sp. NBC_01298 TaxID=2903817 RepID=UPI002E0FE5E1|nr:DUF6225 family protein [Streptomyces sp. NBC_01298]WSK25947.1 DUF6225 family protein [Streptomyces sp. NBC_01298]
MSTRRIDSEGYHHRVAAWTVGQLRAALAGLPDDTLVAASIPHSLGPRPNDPAGAEDSDWVVTDLEEAPSASEPLVLVLDRPTGRYVFIHREEEGE